MSENEVSDLIKKETSDSEDEVSDCSNTEISNNSLVDVVLTQDMNGIQKSDSKIHQDSCHKLYLSCNHRISEFGTYSFDYQPGEDTILYEFPPNLLDFESRLRQHPDIFSTLLTQHKDRKIIQFYLYLQQWISPNGVRYSTLKDLCNLSQRDNFKCF